MPIKTYAKGARHERDLLHILTKRGFSCIRAASSGGFLTPADIVAIKKGLVLAIESKAWNKMPHLSKDKIRDFQEWCKQASAIGILAWKPPSEKWKMILLSHIADGNYDEDMWLSMDTVLDAVDV